MGSNVSRLDSSSRPYYGPRSIDHPWPTRPHYPSRSSSSLEKQSLSSADLNPTSLQVRNGAIKANLNPGQASATPSRSISLSDHSSSAGALSVPSRSTSSTSHSSREDQRPGRVSSLGICGRYHHNPSGLAGHYNWEAEEGGYIPFHYQAAHRKKWRREMRYAQKEEQRERARKIEAVEEKKAARRREYENHLASRTRGPQDQDLHSTESDGEAAKIPADSYCLRGK